MSNQAAWIPALKGRFKVDGAPYSSPGPEEVVIRNAAVAINPVDWKIQTYGFLIQEFPNILGVDVAGEVAEVGAEVKKVRKGDRVLGHALGLQTLQPKHAAFQHYTVIPAIAVAPIPDALSFERAAVLPLAISTAAAGLFQKEFLGLPYPTENAKHTGKAILVWGGSSSVGGSAIQLAKNAGVKVVTTASNKNHSYVKALGADEVFDYNSPSVVEDIVKALKGSEFAGVYDAISEEKTVKASAAVANQLGGGIVATVIPPPEGLPSSVKASSVFAVTIFTKDTAVGDAIYRDFIPTALRDGRLQAKPDPKVITGGLSQIQEGVDLLKQGVSASKVVVTL